MYEKTARKDGFRFFGGVELGEDITRAELLERYHAVLYAVGTGVGQPARHPRRGPARLLRGDALRGLVQRPPARLRRASSTCRATRAVVVGNGNVAIDIARMLVLDPDELAPTDTADHALQALAAAQVEEVILLGRRGPAQAAFTNPELRELGELSRAVAGRRAGRARARRAQPQLAGDGGRPDREAQLRAAPEYAARPLGDASHRITLRFLRSPRRAARRRARTARSTGDADRPQPDRARRRRPLARGARPTARRSSPAGW